MSDANRYRDQWFINLARSTWNGEQWLAADPAKAQMVAAEQLHETMSDLEHFALTAAEIFNHAAATNTPLPGTAITPESRKIHVLALPAAAGQHHHQGLMLVHGALQMRVEFKPWQLDVFIIQTSSFERQSTQVMRFVPRVDALGAVLWEGNDHQQVNLETVVRKLFSQLVQAGFEVSQNRQPTEINQ